MFFPGKARVQKGRAQEAQKGRKCGRRYERCVKSTFQFLENTGFPHASVARYRQREGGVVQSVLSESQVVLATCHTSGSRQLRNQEFDVLIIDEATQALEAVSFINDSQYQFSAWVLGRSRMRCAATDACEVSLD